ncbi:MAG: hypothetical protein HC880_19865, partial [Bacteroidia bacterium]|nr:hypothetical protein [Bacteroidia bacterium]
MTQEEKIRMILARMDFLQKEMNALRREVEAMRPAGDDAQAALAKKMSQGIEALRVKPLEPGDDPVSAGLEKSSLPSDAVKNLSGSVSS